MVAVRLKSVRLSFVSVIWDIETMVLFRVAEDCFVTVWRLRDKWNASPDCIRTVVSAGFCRSIRDERTPTIDVSTTALMSDRATSDTVQYIWPKTVPSLNASSFALRNSRPRISLQLVSWPSICVIRGNKTRATFAFCIYRCFSCLFYRTTTKESEVGLLSQCWKSFRHGLLSTAKKLCTGTS